MGKNPLPGNALDNVKKYYNKKKFEKYSGRGEKSIAIIILDILIVIVFIITFYYIYFINTEKIVKIAGYVAIALFTAFCVVRIISIVINNGKSLGGITKLVLVDDNGKSVRTWIIENKVSLLIGKSTLQGEVDIDLSSTEYHELVSRQHAVLNYSNDTWFIEDLDSRNGSGIQRANESEKFRIEPGKLYRLNPGDAIYIANTKILLK